MKTYAALASSKKSYHLRVLRDVSYPYVLVSYAYDKSGTWFDKLGYSLNGMLDSGAFTVRTKGIEIDLGEYIDWAKEYASRYPQVRVTNLDVIPQRGASKRDRTKCAKLSAENAETIRSAGLRVLEVHHLTDPIEAFEQMVERRRPGEVIGVAGLDGRGATRAAGIAYGDAVFARLRDMCGWEKLPPIHGFGVASTQGVVFRFPLASIDASTWVAPDRFGQVLEGNTIRRRERHSDHLRHTSVSSAEGKRILAAWIRREAEIKRFWADRGVMIEEEGAALVGG